ncbi:MAG: BrnA antitoxin family protein [Candidatus Omnitrophica bacterium]|nr:BrnA antitoxin family protein [Candidatus Omnitrophota bacterium]
MKKEYDFSKMKKRRNPYASHLKKPITIRLGTDVIEYFKAMSNEVGVPYQNLMNSYLRDCANAHRKLEWTKR